MTNEQLAVLLMNLRSRLANEIDNLRAQTQTLDVVSYRTERQHTSGTFCWNCKNEAHFEDVQIEERPNPIALDALDAFVSDLDDQIALLESVRESIS